MEWWNNFLVVILIFGGLLFASAIGALVWASRSGQLDNFEKGARTIFTDEEPEGEQIDFFPGKKGESRSSKAHLKSKI